MPKTKKSTTKKIIKKEKPKRAKISKREKEKDKDKDKEKETKIKKERIKQVRYYEAVGRRKTAVARVRIFTKGEKEILINEKPYQAYFSFPEFWKEVIAPLEKMNCLTQFRILVKVKGGGIRGQAQAVRHGIAKALVKFNPNFRKRLKKAGYLTRDPRMRERKKFGLKRARRAPQWQKR